MAQRQSIGSGTFSLGHIIQLVFDTIQNTLSIIVAAFHSVHSWHNLWRLDPEVRSLSSDLDVRILAYTIVTTKPEYYTYCVYWWCDVQPWESTVCSQAACGCCGLQNIRNRHMNWKPWTSQLYAHFKVAILIHSRHLTDCTWIPQWHCLWRSLDHSLNDLQSIF